MIPCLKTSCNCAVYGILAAMNIILFETVPTDGFIPANDFRGEHIMRILKLAVGDSFQLGEIDGRQGLATITTVSPQGVWFSWNPQTSRPNMYPVTLLVAQVRPICMKRILREAVSLGVEQILVTGADTAEHSYQDAKLWSTGEYRKYLLDGAMQSACTGMSRIQFLKRVDDVVDGTWDFPGKLLLDNMLPGERLADFTYRGGRLVLAIGPERGWSDRERDVLVEGGFQPYTLGGRVLRTETACSAGVAVLLARMGLL